MVRHTCKSSNLRPLHCLFNRLKQLQNTLPLRNGSKVMLLCYSRAKKREKNWSCTCDNACTNPIFTVKSYACTCALNESLVESRLMASITWLHHWLSKKRDFCSCGWHIWITKAVFAKRYLLYWELINQLDILNFSKHMYVLYLVFVMQRGNISPCLLQILHTFLGSIVWLVYVVSLFLYPIWKKQ